MRFWIAAPAVIVVALPLLGGCKQTVKERLEGRWVGERVENFQPAQVVRAQGWATGTSFEFKGSRVTVSIPAESARHGTYKIAQLSGDDLQVSFLRPTGASDVVKLQLQGDDHMRWQLDDGRSILMRKVD